MIEIPLYSFDQITLGPPTYRGAHAHIAYSDGTPFGAQPGQTSILWPTPDRREWVMLARGQRITGEDLTVPVMRFEDDVLQFMLKCVPEGYPMELRAAMRVRIAAPNAPMEDVDSGAVALDDFRLVESAQATSFVPVRRWTAEGWADFHDSLTWIDR